VNSGQFVLTLTFFVELIENRGRALGIAIQTIRVRGVAEFDAAFAAMVNEQADAVIVQGSLPRKPALEWR
jgi:hypothetical protein